MLDEQIICIFCGKQADIVERNGKIVVLCRHCKRETEGDTYQVIFDKWLGDVRREDSGRRK